MSERDMTDVIEKLSQIRYSSNDPSLGDTLTQAIGEIAKLRRERDEARRIAAYQYAKHHNGDEDTLVKNFFEFRGWDCSKDKK
jgi:hypothetical protein